MPYRTLPIGDNAPDEVHAVIEIPRGSSNKYEYDKELGVFKLDRPLYSPLFYPFDIERCVRKVGRFTDDAFLTKCERDQPLSCQPIIASVLAGDT